MKSPLKAWVRALEMTAPIDQQPLRTLPILIDELADQFADAPALASPGEALTYTQLAGDSRRYARWAASQGLQRGDIVGLLMPNSVHYMPIWLGLSRAGISVALLNTQLRGEVLAHCIRIVAPKLVIVGHQLCDAVPDVRPRLDPEVSWWVHGPTNFDLPRLDLAITALDPGPMTSTEISPSSLNDRALFIYTSGTTGLPKAANVSHYRVMQWSHWFAGMMDTAPSDRMYNCLPLYHSVGGVVATGATLVSGGAVVIRERFSARDFWRDVAQERCTLFQYIGELCRYLLNSATDALETSHSLRLCCGNGLRGEVWEPFQARFQIPQILEYYASTEGNFSLYNCEGKAGAIGRIPPFLKHRMPVEIVKFDLESELPTRDPQGHCTRCDQNEVGEALGKLQSVEGGELGRFEGYADAAATSKKVLRDVFEDGDAWYRTGDLMRKDDKGFFYFADRVGDTYRWKGENVSTAEVTGIIASCPGVTDAAVYGVQIPGTDGQAGMAAVVAAPGFDLQLLRDHLSAHLPEYSRPVFMRIVQAVELTGTFKLRKQTLIAEGFDPNQVSGVFVHDRARQLYKQFDSQLHSELLSGSLKL